jgi:hypothetical protein
VIADKALADLAHARAFAQCSPIPQCGDGSVKDRGGFAFVYQIAGLKDCGVRRR